LRGAKRVSVLSVPGLSIFSHLLTVAALYLQWRATVSPWILECHGPDQSLENAGLGAGVIKTVIMESGGIRGQHMIRDVKDLSPDQKTAVETLLGRPVSEQETVSVQAFQPPAISDQRRREIVEALQQYFAEVDAKRLPVSAEEADDIINEAMRNSRPGYRPRQ
jgi:hypothetical protein